MVCNRIIARLRLNSGITPVDVSFTLKFPLRIKCSGKIMTPHEYKFWFCSWETIDLYKDSAFVMRLSQKEASAINEHFNIMGYI